MKKESRLLTIKEAAERIGVSSGYMRELLKNGEVTHIRLGPPPLKGKADRRHYRIDEEDLEAYLNMRKVAGTFRGVKDISVREWRMRGLV